MIIMQLYVASALHFGTSVGCCEILPFESIPSMAYMDVKAGARGFQSIQSCSCQQYLAFGGIPDLGVHKVHQDIDNKSVPMISLVLYYHSGFKLN
jgi:hypothetical protein